MKKTITTAAMIMFALAGCASSNAAEVAKQGMSTPEGAAYIYFHGAKDSDFGKLCEVVDPASRKVLDDKGGCEDILSEAIGKDVIEQFQVFDGSENYTSEISGDTAVVTVSVNGEQNEFDTIKDGDKWFIAGGLE